MHIVHVICVERAGSHAFYSVSSVMHLFRFSYRLILFFLYAIDC